MKRIVCDKEESGLERFMGETVLLLCGNYFYYGKLVALSDTDIELKEAGIVYETGNWSEKGFDDFQKLPGNVFVKVQAVEAYVQM